MSYILDALRRAEAERQRGAVPGLHAQPLAGTLPARPGGPDSAQRTWHPGTLVMAGLLLAGLLIAAVGLGWLLKPSAEAIPVVARPLALPAALPVEMPAVLPAVLPQPVMAPALPTTGPAAGSAVGSAAAPPTGQPPPTAIKAAAPTAAPIAAWVRPPVAATPAVPTAAPVAGLAAQPALSAGPVAAPARLPTLAELPEALRREVQPLNLGGAVYAEQAPLRIVIVNGQVFHEGDKPLPELQVQQIRMKSVVFSVRGQRFEMSL